MKRLLYLHFDSPERAGRAHELEKHGFAVAVAEPVWPDCKALVHKLRPAAIILDASVRPSEVRECARALGETRATRSMPHLLLNVTPSDWATTRERAKWAEMVAWSRLAERLSRIKG